MSCSGSLNNDSLGLVLSWNELIDVDETHHCIKKTLKLNYSRDEINRVKI